MAAARVGQSIVFERVEDLVACAEAVSSDERLQLVAVTNRLDPSRDARETAGFRHAPPAPPR